MLRKKQNLKKFVCIALVLLLMLSIFATSFYPINAYAASTDEELMNQYISHYEKDNVYISHISQEDFVELKSNSTIKRVSDVELFKQIYLALGYTIEDIENIGEAEINYLMEKTSEITVYHQYVRVTQEGELEILSEEECMAAAEAINAEREAKIEQQALQALANQNLIHESNFQAIVNFTSTNDGSNEVTSSDDYMKITTKSDYIAPSSANGEDGWYNLSATFKWLTTPEQTHIDAFSLYADCVTWAQEDVNFFAQETYDYTVHNVVNGETTYYTDDEMNTISNAYKEVSSTGVYYTCELPESYSSLDPYLGLFLSYQVSDLTYYMRAKARMDNSEVAQSFNLFSRYEHLYETVNINTSFSWNVGSMPGVSVLPSLENEHDTYSSYNFTYYDPN